MTALGSNALDKKEQNFTDLRKTVVDLIKDSISLGIKDEIFNTLIVDGDIYGSFQFSKNKRRRKHDGKKVNLIKNALDQKLFHPDLAFANRWLNRTKSCTVVFAARRRRASGGEAKMGPSRILYNIY